MIQLAHLIASLATPLIQVISGHGVARIDLVAAQIETSAHGKIIMISVGLRNHRHDSGSDPKHNEERNAGDGQGCQISHQYDLTFIDLKILGEK